MAPSRSPTPWIIAFLEGFSTLAVEVIAIRLAVPVVGSSITLTGVMLGVVLFALSAGYWRGGVLSAQWDTAHTRTRLTRNLLIAAVLYFLVVSPYARFRARFEKAPAPEPETMECPHCLSRIPVGATRCAFCTIDLQSSPSPTGRPTA